MYIFLYVAAIYVICGMKSQKQEFSTIFVFTFTHRCTGTNEPRWQNVIFHLVI